MVSSMTHNPQRTEPLLRRVWLPFFISLAIDSDNSVNDWFSGNEAERRGLIVVPLGLISSPRARVSGRVIVATT